MKHIKELNEMSSSNEVHTYQKNNFTVADFLDLSKSLNPKAVLYNSNYTLDHTQRYMIPKEFEAIIGAHDTESPNVRMEWQYSTDKHIYPALTVDDIIKRITDGSFKDTASFDRDVDDGYRYDKYDSIVYNDDMVVFCESV